MHDYHLVANIILLTTDIFSKHLLRMDWIAYIFGLVGLISKIRTKNEGLVVYISGEMFLIWQQT